MRDRGRGEIAVAYRRGYAKNPGLGPEWEGWTNEGVSDEPRTLNVSVLFEPRTSRFFYCEWPRAAIGHTASTLSPRIAYIWSYSFTTGSQCGTISSILSPTLYDRCAVS